MSASRQTLQAFEPRSELLPDADEFPNSNYPALIYRRVFAEGDLASAFEALFAQNGWTGSWRNGLYRTHHYHSTAHEVLGVYRGSVKVRLGGPEGPLVELEAGDVAILPAGVAHKNESQSADFAVVGAYPNGTSPDMNYGKPGERPSADHNIARVPRPLKDPVGGPNGGLLRHWR
ncbi:MAG TPA: cupin domain-containing protein [Polyangiaceae bacterium]